MKKNLLPLLLALVLLLALAAPALAATDADALAALEAMERFMANGGQYKLLDDDAAERDVFMRQYHYVDFDRDGIPELVRQGAFDAMQGYLDVLAAKKTAAGYEIEKVAGYIDSGYHMFGGGTDYLYRFGQFADGTYGVVCWMPKYVGQGTTEPAEVSYLYYAYRDGAFVQTEENGFDMTRTNNNDIGPFTLFTPGDFGACASAQNLTVDGVQKNVEKYNILGSNYFKLRDIAMLLNGTPAQFSVGWDEASGVVSITPGAPYEPVGGELTVGADKSASAIPSAQTVKIDGWTRSDLTVFNLEGNNFFKLRDLGEALGFYVDYDAAANAATVDSTPRRSTLRDGEYRLILSGYSEWIFHETDGSLECDVSVVESTGAYDELNGAALYKPTGERGTIFLPDSLRITSHHFVSPVTWTPQQLRDNVEVLTKLNIMTVTIEGGDVTAMTIGYHP